jgi:hypothetical protein
MEYLMTYGWAILVVLIALGALFYLGVFSPKTPSTCTVPSPLTCADVQASAATDDLILVLGASGTSAATLTNVIVNSPSGYDCTISGGTISTDVPTSVSCLGDGGAGDDLSEGTKLSGTGTATYTLQGSTIVHTTEIQFSGTVEA